MPEVWLNTVTGFPRPGKFHGRERVREAARFPGKSWTRARSRAARVILVIYYILTFWG